MAAREIGIMCDEQYQHLRELLGKPRTINSMDFFDLAEGEKKEKFILVDGKKVEVEFVEYSGGGDFFKIDGIKKKDDAVKIQLKHTSKEENRCYTDMPTEG